MREFGNVKGVCLSPMGHLLGGDSAYLRELMNL